MFSFCFQSGNKSNQWHDWTVLVWKNGYSSEWAPGIQKDGSVLAESWLLRLSKNPRRKPTKVQGSGMESILRRGSQKYPEWVTRSCRFAQRGRRIDWKRRISAMLDTKYLWSHWPRFLWNVCCFYLDQIKWRLCKTGDEDVFPKLRHRARWGKLSELYFKMTKQKFPL